MLVHKLSDKGRRYVTLEDTLIGYVANNLTWCGQASGDGINYETCPPFKSCAEEPMKTFWQSASKWFASQAVGKVSVLLNGSNPSRKAYRSDREYCSNQSLLDLRKEVEEKNIKFDCFVNPGEVKLLLCRDSEHHPECAQQNAAVILRHFMYGSSMWAQLTSATTMATLLMISFMCM